MSWEQLPDWAVLTTQALLQALRERDPYTYGHCRRVSRQSRLLAAAAGLSTKEQEIVEYASLFHDLGKLGIPDSVLLKPGRLTQAEETIMREHPLRSAEILTPLTSHAFFKQTIPGILHHHERIDGLGYPFGKKGDEIPLVARIILITDTFDAMTTTRPYRKGFPMDVAYKELKLFSGRQFDPQLVKTFIDAHPKWENFETEITEEFVTRTFKRAA